MNSTLDKTNRKKDLSGRFESEKDLPLSRKLNEKEQKMIQEFEERKKMRIYDKNLIQFTNGCLVSYQGKNYDLSISDSGVHLINDYEERHIEARNGDILEDIAMVTDGDKCTGSLFEQGEDDEK